jgi:hypothetical protein
MFKLVMIGNQKVDDFGDFIPEQKTTLEEFYSVQFFVNGQGIFYQFKLRNIFSNRSCILVKKDSPVFKELKVGDILEMEYNKLESSAGSKLFKTQVISKKSHNHYVEHFIVELSIIDN